MMKSAGGLGILNAALSLSLSRKRGESENAALRQDSLALKVCLKLLHNAAIRCLPGVLELPKDHYETSVPFDMQSHLEFALLELVSKVLGL